MSKLLLGRYYCYCPAALVAPAPTDPRTDAGKERGFGAVGRRHFSLIALHSLSPSSSHNPLISFASVAQR